MVRRLKVLIFVFLIGSNVLTGTSLFAQKLEMMACCKSSFKSGDPVRVSAAHLCCVLNCSQSGVTSSTTNGGQATQFVPLRFRDHRFGVEKLHVSQRSSRSFFYEGRLSPSNSPPAYLRHSAFLI